MDFSLIFPAFIAGILTFLAPCTLPLVPGYLGFISGASADEMTDPQMRRGFKKKILINALLYVAGFSGIFILLGLLFGIGGLALAKYQIWLTRIGGTLVIIFGLYLVGAFKKIKLFSLLENQKHFSAVGKLKPGKPLSSFVFGATFAFGWTPCVGPILGSILLLASSTATATQGAVLLSVFSLGLAVPFLLVALGYGHAASVIGKLTKYMTVINIIGGAFLIFLGVVMLTGSMSLWLAYAYRGLEFLNYDALFEYL